MFFVLKIKESILAWGITLIVVTAFARQSRFGVAEEVFIDVLLIAALPVIWGLNYLTFWHRDEKPYKLSQALAFPLSIALGVALTFLITSLLGKSLQSIEALLFFIVASIFLEYFVETQIEAYRKQIDCSSIQRTIGRIATVTLWGVISFLLFMLAYGRLRFFGAIEGSESIDELSLFVINDLYLWFLEDA